MNWSQKAIDLLDSLVRDLPAPNKERAKHHAIQEIEEYCREARIREVGSDQVIIGYIRSTPVHQRFSLRNALRTKGISVEKFEGHFQAP